MKAEQETKENKCSVYSGLRFLGRLGRATCHRLLAERAGRRAPLGFLVIFSLNSLEITDIRESPICDFFCVFSEDSMIFSGVYNCPNSHATARIQTLTLQEASLSFGAWVSLNDHSSPCCLSATPLGTVSPFYR